VTRLPQLVSGLTDECSKLVANFFSGWVSNVIQMENLEACEMAKLVSNAYRDSIFAFANEMAQIASKNNLDINRIILNANAGYARNTIPMPSPGVGGPCLTKDSYMLVSNHELSMVFQSRKINESMIDFSVKRILSLVEELGDNIVIIGAAFKGTPPTNDLRNSTPVDIARALIGISKRVAILDAVATDKEILAQGLHPFKLGEFIPNVICILNNHPDNKELLKTILTSVEGKSGLRIGVFDPWNLTNESDLLGTRTLVSTLSKRGV
jgi:nucleotide sugar dehydrogenase